MEKYDGKRSIRNNYNKIVIKHCWVFSATHAKKQDWFKEILIYFG